MVLGVRVGSAVTVTGWNPPDGLGRSQADLKGRPKKKPPAWSR